MYGIYFKKFIKYTVLTMFTGILTYILTIFLFKGTTLIDFIGKVITCLVLPNMMFFIFTYKTKEYDFLKNLFFIIIKKRKIKSSL